MSDSETDDAPTVVERHSNSEAETADTARALAPLLRGGDVLLLQGPLGAGKTRFVQGLAAALGCTTEDMSSPTFGLVHEYDGPTPVVHMDAYRLRDVDEFYALGGDELLGAGSVACIEWAERIAEALPADAIELTIQPLGQQQRRLRFSAARGHGRHVLEQWQQIIAAASS
ncbi:MAG: tRNA (adenosine(37)-N6)-threonylcarbamoyltransferase complex ATPase subunit type 1 TsaE [Planctomycetaceae bacterium]